jgi:nucleoside-diphosphate-sugar epimerase
LLSGEVCGGPRDHNDVNVNGTLNVLRAADAHVRRLVFSSSSSVYGENPALPKHEELVTMPISPYAVSKLAGEEYTRVFARLYEIETVCLRYFNVFGRANVRTPVCGRHPLFMRWRTKAFP